MTQIMLRYGGDIIKFAGDALLVLWTVQVLNTNYAEVFSQ
jgi:class 3 adenylate cyclase